MDSNRPSAGRGSLPRFGPLLGLVPAALAGLSASCASQVGDYDQRVPYERQPVTVSGMIGARALEDDAWDPVDRPTEFGARLRVPMTRDLAPPYLLYWDLGASFMNERSTRNGVELDLEAVQLDAGAIIRPEILNSTLYPYIGGGLALTFFDTELLDGFGVVDDSDAVVAGYVRGGVEVDVGPGQYVGVDVQWTGGADADIGTVRLPIDGLGVALTFSSTF